ncbi:MAG: preprotein translocase subunit SecE [Fimbriimonadaceae bacterium]|nr:preprotein translocase subunit SecE [Fimbriimonadaceae bacterium]
MPRHRRGFKAFWVEVVRELKKVNWPPHRETNRLTGVVLIVCGMIVAFLVILSNIVAFVFHFITTG